MNKVKAFFGKIKNYINNTAWIQPILIVIIIFVVLFSLNPITEGIKKGWAKITAINNMEKITYQEYIEKVEAQAKGEEGNFVVVFGQSECEDCPVLYKSMNEYLKNASDDFDVYYVDLSTKLFKVEINDVEYYQYKDKTLGLVNPTNGAKQNIIEKDYLLQLDDRIDAFVKSFGDTSYDDITTSLSNAIENSDYTYINTPIIVWYKNGLETRICNQFKSKVTLTSDEKQATGSSFRNFIENFGDGKNGTTKADNWDETFDLTYFSGKSIKD